MGLGRRSFIKGLASLALLPSLSWARMEKLEIPRAMAAGQSLMTKIDVYVSDYGEHRILSPRFLAISSEQFAAEYLAYYESKEGG